MKELSASKARQAEEIKTLKRELDHSAETVASLRKELSERKSSSVLAQDRVSQNGSYIAI